MLKFKLTGLLSVVLVIFFLTGCDKKEMEESRLGIQGKAAVIGEFDSLPRGTPV